MGALEIAMRGKASKQFGKLALSLSMTALFSFWAFRDTHWAEMWASLKSARYVWVVPFLFSWLVIHLLRTLRWGSLLSGMERVPFRQLNQASAIGFMMLLVLPVRLGEFARPFLIAQRSSISKSAAMATVVIERIADGIFIAVTLRILLFFVPANAPGRHLVSLGANGMLLIFVGGLAFLLFSVWQKRRAVWLIEATAGRISDGLARRVVGTMESFVDAAARLPSVRHVLSFIVYTILYWTLNGLSMGLLSKAFSLELSPFQCFVILGVTVVGVMIPSAPGMVGTFQAFVRIGLGLFFPASVVASTGLAYVNVLWLCQTFIQVGLGLIFLGQSHLSFRQMAELSSSESEGEETQSEVDEMAAGPGQRRAAF